VWTPAAGWVEKFPTDSPGPRYDAAMAYDAERGKTILFGGYGNNYLSDTWEWDGENWKKLETANNPGARYLHQMIYDANLKKIFLFGGYNRTKWTWEDDDTYAWDGENWTRVAETGPNPSYSEFAMAYDVKNQNTIYLDHSGTWTFNGTAWSKLETVTDFPKFYKIYGYSNGNVGKLMAYDPVRQNVVFAYNNLDLNRFHTWIWDGASWAEKNTNSTSIFGRGFNVVSTENGVLGLGGYTGSYSYAGKSTNYSRRTETWNGSEWSCYSALFHSINMNQKPNGIWNYTTINVGKDTTVVFERNAANTPVHWLATGEVIIDGDIYLSGENGRSNEDRPANAALGGVGGFSGGLGGTKFHSSGSYAGTPGQGPGGGQPGTDFEPPKAFGYPGEFTGAYGNAYLQPLIGGSGGGGTASGYEVNGASGGGGGGAILIASSRDITLNGKIFADGGASSYVSLGNSQSYTYSGPGSGGAVRLAADRVNGNGEVSTRMGNNGYYWNGSFWSDASRGTGRIRIEGFFRELASTGSFSETPVAASPTETVVLPNPGALVITSVAGKNVAQPPSGRLSTPDVIFTEPGEITVAVEANGIPDGSPVKLRISMASGVINTQAVNLAAGKASIKVQVPAGLGTILASTSYTAPVPPPAETP